VPEQELESSGARIIVSGRRLNAGAGGVYGVFKTSIGERLIARLSGGSLVAGSGWLTESASIYLSKFVKYENSST
jgi:hypothetical protein